MAFAYYMYAMTGNTISGVGSVAGTAAIITETGIDSLSNSGTVFVDGLLTDAGGNFSPPNPINANETFSVTGGLDNGTAIFFGGWNNGDFRADVNGVNYFFSESPTLTGGVVVAGGSPNVNYIAGGPYVFDNSHDTSITLTCFLAGTMIRTAVGETAIEKLAIGDRVVTADGSMKPVKFIGRQTVAMLFSDRSKSQPVLIKAGALGVNSPARDLYVSPGHAMFVDGVLAIAGALVNGSSIVRWADVPASFSYYHVELEEHAIIFAEGAATETYCDNVPRDVFDNAAEYKALYPVARPIVQLDLPTAKSARQLPAETKRRLAARAVEIGATAVKQAA